MSSPADAPPTGAEAPPAAGAVGDDESTASDATAVGDGDSSVSDARFLAETVDATADGDGDSSVSDARFLAETVDGAAAASEEGEAGATMAVPRNLGLDIPPPAPPGVDEGAVEPGDTPPQHRSEKRQYDKEGRVLMAHEVGFATAAFSGTMSVNPAMPPPPPPTTGPYAKDACACERSAVRNGARAVQKRTARRKQAYGIAAAKGDAAKLKALRGAAPEGWPLAVAATRHYAAVVAALLEAGANPDAPAASGPAHGRTPLLLACRTRGGAAVAKLLLGRGASPNAADRVDGMTPLLHACVACDAAAVEALLAHPKPLADRDAPNRRGDRPLLRAASAGSVAIVEMLLSAGAASKAYGPRGESALVRACAAGHYAVCRTLIERDEALVGHPDKHGNTPLFHAVTRGHIDVLQLLLARGARYVAAPLGLLAAAATPDSPLLLLLLLDTTTSKRKNRAAARESRSASASARRGGARASTTPTTATATASARSARPTFPTPAARPPRPSRPAGRSTGPTTTPHPRRLRRPRRSCPR